MQPTPSMCCVLALTARVCAEMGPDNVSAGTLEQLKQYSHRPPVRSEPLGKLEHSSS